MTTLQDRAYDWHTARFPGASCEHVLLKSGEELGEVMSAWNALAGVNSATGHGGTIEHFVDECADTVISLLVAVSRWTDGDLLAAVGRKLDILNTPGAHKASVLP